MNSKDVLPGPGYYLKYHRLIMPEIKNRPSIIGTVLVFYTTLLLALTS